MRPFDRLQPLEDVSLSLEACRGQIGPCNLQNGISADECDTGDRSRPGTIATEVMAAEAASRLCRGATHGVILCHEVSWSGAGRNV